MQEEAAVSTLCGLGSSIGQRKAKSVNKSQHLQEVHKAGSCVSVGTCRDGAGKAATARGGQGDFSEGDRELGKDFHQGCEMIQHGLQKIPGVATQGQAERQGGHQGEELRWSGGGGDASLPEL